MVVFVCSPYGGKRANLKRAIDYCLAEIDMGNVPFAPHLLYPQMLDEATDRQLGIDMGLEILGRCDELHAWGGMITPGMQKEIDAAEHMGIPVRYMEVTGC